MRGTSVIETGSEAPDFDLEVDGSERVRLADFRGRRNVLLVFHPSRSPRSARTRRATWRRIAARSRRPRRRCVLVSCDTAPARQAWKRELGLSYTLASDFWPHGAAARAYGVFDESTGAAVRGTFLIDKQGVVVWSLVNDADTRRTELASAPLAPAGS